MEFSGVARPRPFGTARALYVRRVRASSLQFPQGQLEMIPPIRVTGLDQNDAGSVQVISGCAGAVF